MGAYANAVLATSGIANFYDLDDTSGTTAVDGTGTRNGTYAGGFTLNQPGQSGQSVAFNGTTGNVTTAAVNLTGTASVTLEAWFNTTNAATTDQTVISNGNGATGYSIVVSGSGVGSQHLAVLFHSVRWMDVYFKVLTGIWYHVALVLDASSKPTVYVNGIQTFTDTGTNPLTPLALSCIGSENGASRFFAGRVDGAAYYTAALTAADVLAHYRLGEAFLPGRSLPAKPTFIRGVTLGSITNGLVAAVPMAEVGQINSAAGSAGTKPPLDVVSQVRTVTDTNPGGSFPLYQSGLTSCDLGFMTAATNAIKVPATISQRSFSAETWLTFRGWKTNSPFRSAVWTMAIDSGDVQLYFGDSNDPPDYPELAAGLTGQRPKVLVPHQLVMVGSPGDLVLYIDGELWGAKGSAATNLTATAFRIGTDSTESRSPNALVHQFNVWNRPLSAAEVWQRFSDPWGLYDEVPPVRVFAEAGRLSRVSPLDGLGGGGQVLLNPALGGAA